MKVERIVKKDENNVVVHFDNGEKLYLSFEVLMKSGLRKNDEISGDLFSMLVEENQKYFIKQAAFRYIARRTHSEFELKIKLLQKKYNREFIEEVLSELSNKKLIDDSKFAEQFTEEKINSKKWGLNKVKAELMKRGINREIIDSVLSGRNAEGNSFNNAMLIASKKLKSLTHYNYENKKLRQKLFSYLTGRGYDFETTREVVGTLISDEY